MVERLDRLPASSQECRVCRIALTARTLAPPAGAQLGGGKGSDILEHPLNAVVWLAQALAQEGLAMKPGDLISLGSFSALLPPKPGLQATATYHGLPGAAPVTVQFK